MNDVTIRPMFARFNQEAAEDGTGTNNVTVTNRIIRIIK